MSSGPKPGSARPSSSTSTLRRDDVDLLAAVDDRRADGVAERPIEQAELLERRTQRQLGEALVEQRAKDERLRAGELGGHPLDPGARDRCHVDGEAPGVEPGEDPTELADRAAANAERCVAAGAADGALEPADLLLGHLDRVEALPADPDPRAAELAERVTRSREELGMLLGQEAGAVFAAVLLVAQHREDDIAAGPQLPARRTQEGVDEHRDAALHVERAAAPEPAVDELAAERRSRPLLAGRRDDVDVPVQQQRRRIAGSGHARDQVGPGIVARDDARLDTGALEQLLYVRDARALVAGRVRGVEPEQVAEKLDDVRHSSFSALSTRSTSAALL
jgi:hypothetical protein